MRSRFWLFALVPLAAIAYFVVDRQAGYAWQNLPPQAEGQQFRIIVGLKDAQPRRWQGRIQVTGVEIDAMSGWRFSGPDRANPDGTFNFQTKMQPLEDQLRPGSAYGATPMTGNPEPRQVPEGLLLKTHGGNAARVTFDSPDARFEFNGADLSFGESRLFLDGNVMVEKLPFEQRLSDPGATNDQPAIAATPAGVVWTAWVAYKDKSDVIQVSDGSRVYTVGERGDLHAPAIAASADEVYVAWPRYDNGVYHLYGAAFRKAAWSKPERLTDSAGNDVWPRMAADDKGKQGSGLAGFS